ncbi:shikimate dehydrogenase (NADP(+)) [Alicyclobacillus cellulosilyticus]|uniref:Shikimate dehydrogenase (NADP(+)) n=1 Tax=Alicyclobacillus cellulosilyticus TaxID=1003997 RepID=A0A917NNZ5_9BACL|nr:shikimate dehydrogenase [Alicyclobacillus cellulosilyticus]GGJ12064.1 shikimate dehydrogenase (NADP(+)) [Alicyclobacillus cellulosilyticus]
MGQTLFGLLGWPVGHSVSPAMMNAAFAALDIDAVYVAFGVRPERIAAAVAGLAALGARGCNVTIPHKRAVFELVHERTPEAVLAQAVNTVRFDEAGERWIGHNTDVSGWWRSIADLAAGAAGPFAVLGAGGAARAVLAALALERPGTKVALIARDLGKASQLQRAVTGVDVELVAWDDRHAAIAAAQVVVNTTPIGMWPHADASPVADPACFRPGQIVQDIVYRPLTTRFMAQASARGAVVRDGLGMLIHQGAAAFSFWLGREAPVAVMAEAARAALGEGAEPSR